MRIGQTSFVVFASKLVGSALGFVATIYFARELGAAVLGYYALAIALVAWMKLVGNLGVASAMIKRMSEGEEPAAFATASAGLVALLGAFLAALVVVFADRVDAYVGEPVAPLVAVILLVGLLESFGYAALHGECKVHVAGLLGPVGPGVRSLLQIGFVGAAVATALSAALGLGLAGYVLGGIVDYRVPVGEIGRQFLAAGVMGAVVWGLETLVETGTEIDHNFGTLVLLVTFGTATYFLTLFGISARFRGTVLANSPGRVSYISG